MHMGNRLLSFAIAAAAFIVVTPTLSLAQEQTTPRPAARAGAEATGEPVVIVSIANLEELTNDVNYVANALNQPTMGSMFGMMANTYSNGIDRTRPIGAAVMMPEEGPGVVVFLPTSDVKRVLKTFEAQIGAPDELDDGTLAVATGPSIIYIRQQGDWAYVAQTQELLDGLPDDPTVWLDGLAEQYDLAVRVNVQALSPEQREMVISQIRQGFEQAMDAQPAEQAEQVRQMGAQSIEQLELVIKDTEVLQFGFAIEPDAKQLKFEVLMTAAPGTELATLYSGYQAIPSKFASVIRPTAAAYFHGATSISPMGIEQTKASLEQATAAIKTALESAENIAPEDRAQLQAFFERLIEIGVETIQEGKTDAGGLLTLDDQQMNAVAGFFVSDGAKVAQLMKDLAAKIEASNTENAPEFTFDAATYKGVNLHYIESAVPEDKEAARQIFGPTLRLTVGTGTDAVYLALGQNSEPMLRKLIDSAGSDNGEARPLSQGQVRLMPILEFAQSINANESVAAMIDALARSGDTGKIRFVSQSIERGSTTEMTIGEGILRAIGAALASQQQQQQQNLNQLR